MLFEHVCILFMSIGIIIYIVGTILYIKNNNQVSKYKSRYELVSKYKSQYNQDSYLENQIFKGYKNGFYVDVGAHDGLTINNTLYFER